jgi:[acyl-carrier-protein] S-malonyltransferase
MQASGAGREGRMAAIIGLDDDRLPELLDRAGAHGVFGLANRNSPGQVVVSGERPAVEAAVELAKELGTRRAIIARCRSPAPPLSGRHRRRAADRARSRFADPRPCGC